LNFSLNKEILQGKKLEDQGKIFNDREKEKETETKREGETDSNTKSHEETKQNKQLHVFSPQKIHEFSLERQRESLVRDRERNKKRECSDRSIINKDIIRLHKRQLERKQDRENRERKKDKHVYSCKCNNGHLWWQKTSKREMASSLEQVNMHPIDSMLHQIPEEEEEKGNLLIQNGVSIVVGDGDLDENMKGDGEEKASTMVFLTKIEKEQTTL